MSIVVFLGPSLSVDEARAILAADYQPPAKAGDVYAVAIRKPTAIAIIDGLFGAVPAVWHKEILFALSRRIPVFGASSMGALRAAELRSFGMQGIGEIYRQFVAGELEDDDEVALQHGPRESGYRPLTEPMVNVREGLRLALAKDLISATSHHLILELAKNTFYADRHWPALCGMAQESGISQQETEALLSLIKRAQPDLKRDDARLLLGHLAAAAVTGIKPIDPGFTLQRSVFFQRMTETAGNSCPARI